MHILTWYMSFLEIGHLIFAVSVCSLRETYACVKFVIMQYKPEFTPCYNISAHGSTFSIAPYACKQLPVWLTDNEAAIYYFYDINNILSRLLCISAKLTQYQRGWGITSIITCLRSITCQLYKGLDRLIYTNCVDKFQWFTMM